MAERNIGKITQIIGAVLDVKYAEGQLPEINEAIEITRSNGEKLVVEVAQHLGDDTVRCFCFIIKSSPPKDAPKAARWRLSV